MTKHIKIDPEHFEDQIRKGKSIYDDVDVLQFLVNRMAKAGVKDVSMTQYEGEASVVWQGDFNRFSVPALTPENPPAYVWAGMVEVCHILNNYDLECWITKQGGYKVHIKPNNEIAEAEDNIEAAS